MTQIPCSKLKTTQIVITESVCSLIDAVIFVTVFYMYAMQGGLIATLMAEQHQTLICALLLSGPALDCIPAFESFKFSCYVRL